MARKKTFSKTALTGVADLSMRLNGVAENNDDPENIIAEYVEAQVSIPYDDGSKGTSVRRKASDAFTTAEAVTFQRLVDKIRDHLLDESGVTDVG